VRLRLLAAALLLAAAIAAPARAQPATTPPGSAFGLAPPPGFAVDPAFTGFADPARPGTSIVLSEMPARAYARIEQGLTAEALARNGITLATREDFATPVGTGLLITATQRVEAPILAKWMLVVPAAAGTETATGLVVATIPLPDAATAADAPTDAAIRAAFATLAFTPLSLEQKRDALPFRIADGPTLKLGQTLSGSGAVLTLDGRSDGPGAPMLAIAYAPGAAVPLGERATAALVLSRQLGGLSEVRRSPPAESGDTLRIDGTGRSRDGTAMRFIQWVAFLPDGHLRILAMADEDRFGPVAAEFETIAAGVAHR